MGKQFAGSKADQLAIGTVRPVGNVGIDMTQFSSGAVARGERWMVTAEMRDATDTKAVLVCATGYDATVQAIKAGLDGNQLTFALTGNSPAGGGVTVEVLLRKNMIVHFEPGVSTVGQVNAAIAAYDADSINDVPIIQVSAAGTVGRVLVAGDAVAQTNLAGGADGVKTTDLILYVRDPSSVRWGLYDDVWGHVVDGKLGTAKAEGVHQFMVRDLAAYDRICFVKAGAGPASAVDVSVTEVLEASRKS